MSKDDLISRDDLKKAFEDTVCIEPMPYAFVKQIIDNAPTVSFMISPDYVTELQNLNKELIKQIEELERPTGKWIEITNGRGGHECNLCGEYASNYQNGREYLSAFCPNCGAKMKGEEE